MKQEDKREKRKRRWERLCDILDRVYEIVSVLSILWAILTFTVAVQLASGRLEVKYETTRPGTYTTEDYFRITLVPGHPEQ